jgi:hypothetical protein
VRSCGEPHPRVANATARDWSPVEVLKVVLRKEEDAEAVRAVLARSRGQLMRAKDGEALDSQK